jgi:hypothetical protein
MKPDRGNPSGTGSVVVVADPTLEVAVALIEQTGLTDEELTALALAADPDAPLPADAVPFGATQDDEGAGGDLLPSWYMPAPVGAHRARSTRHKVAAMSVCVGLAAINCTGLCITYGHLALA